MKNRLGYKALLITVSALICLLAAILVSCNKAPDRMALVKDKISYIEEKVLLFTSDTFNVKCVIGRKERNFIADGKKNDVSEFISITADPIAVDLVNKSFNYVLYGTNGECSGVMNKSILGVTFFSEIFAPTIGEIKRAEIIIEEERHEITFTDLLKDKISPDKAIEIAYNEYSDAMKDDFTDKEFTREVYVRYINDRRDRNSNYYYYVSFYKDSAHYLSALIDGATGKILSKQERL